MRHLKGDVFLSSVFRACQAYIICHPARRASLLLVQALGSFRWTRVMIGLELPLHLYPLTNHH